MALYRLWPLASERATREVWPSGPLQCEGGLPEPLPRQSSRTSDHRCQSSSGSVGERVCDRGCQQGWQRHGGFVHPLSSARWRTASSCQNATDVTINYSRLSTRSTRSVRQNSCETYRIGRSPAPRYSLSPLPEAETSGAFAISRRCRDSCHEKACPSCC